MIPPLLLALVIVAISLFSLQFFFIAPIVFIPFMALAFVIGLLIGASVGIFVGGFFVTRWIATKVAGRRRKFGVARGLLGALLSLAVFAVVLWLFGGFAAVGLQVAGMEILFFAGIGIGFVVGLLLSLFFGGISGVLLGLVWRARR